MEYLYMSPDKINMGSDALFHYRRFSALMESLKDNSFPIYLDHSSLDNYGYGTKWFYPDLILLPFAYIANVTSIPFAYKSMWFIMTILCGIFSYKSMQVITKNKTAAFIGSLTYTFALYRLHDLFKRGAFGESLSFTFIPIVFWGLYEIIKGDYKKWYIISIGFSLLIFSHNISSAITFLTLMIIILFHYKDFLKDKQRIKYLIIAGCCSAILSTYFLLPFFEQIYTTQFYFHDPVAGTLAQHNRSPILKILEGIFSIAPQINIHDIGILLILPLLFRFFIKKTTDTLRYVDIGVIIGFIYIILTLDFIPWSMYPLKLLNFIQFPWRFFEFCSYLFAIAGAYYIVCIIKEKTNLKYIACISVCLFICLQIYLSADYYKKVEKSILLSEMPSANLDNNFFFMNLEYLPQKTSSLSLIEEKGDKISCQNDETIISNFERTSNGLNFNIDLEKVDILELPLIYYKGYNAFVSNQKLEVRESENGFVEIPITTSGKVNIAFTGTPIQKYSLYITLLAYIILGIYILKNSISKLKKDA